MAGGWRPGTGESLAARTQEPAKRFTSPKPLRPSTEGRHCWVLTADGSLDALLLVWRQRNCGWHGHVAYALAGEDAARLILEWLPADQLKRLDLWEVAVER